MRARAWAGAILASTVMLAVAVSGSRAQTPANNARPAAVVNGIPITLTEVDNLVRLMNGPSAVQVPEAMRRQKRLEALAALMDNILLQQFLRQQGPKVNPQEVSKQLTDLETALRKDDKKLSDYLAENGITEAQLREQIVTALQWRDYTKARVNDADVAQYYKDNKDFFDGVQVRASHILIRVPLNASESEVQAARNRLQAIRQEIEAGKISFEDAARKYSQCPSAPKGGDIDYFPRKFVVDEEFAKAAFNPQLRVGDLIGLVRTEHGLHLIKLTDRKSGQPSDFNKIKNDVRDILVVELRGNILAQQRKLAKIDMYLP
jgi:parvulin-like peptidyl-prolyl isomerase